LMNREIRGPWARSTRCESAACVEVAMTNEAVGIRDSKVVDSAVLVFSTSAWEEFLAGVRAGEFEAS